MPSREKEKVFCWRKLMVGCECKTLYRDVYDDLFKQEASHNPDLDVNDPVERKMIHMSVVNIMRPQVRENRKYLTPDREGPPISAGPEFVLQDDGSIFYPEFGKSLQQMYEDQRRVRPQDYSAEEHATMTLMEEAFRNGARVVSHVSHNRDVQGNEAIRDQIIMIWDENAGKGRMIIRNIAQDDRYHSIEGARKVMKSSLVDLTEVHPLSGVFILTDKPVATGQVQEVVSDFNLGNLNENGLYPVGTGGHNETIRQNEQPFSRQIIAEVKSVPGQVITDMVQTARHAGGQTLREVRATMVHIKDYVSGRKRELLEKSTSIVPPFLRRLVTVFDNKNDQKIRTEVKQLAMDGRAGQALRKSEIKEPGVSRDKTQTRIEAPRRIFGLAAETGVGVGAAIWGLRLISELPPNHVNLFSREKKNTKELRRKNKKIFLSRAAEIKELKSKVRTQERQRIKTKEGKRRKERKLKAKKRWEKQQLNRQPIEGEGRRRFLETKLGRRSKTEKALKQRQRKLTVVVLRLAKRMVAVRAELQKFSSKDKQSQEIEQTSKRELASRRVAEVGLAFAWAFWWWSNLNRRLGERAKLERLKTLKRSIISGKLKETTTEALVGKEPTQWVLLAIIWYLVMLREQGLRNIPPKQKNHKKIKKSGIIFTLNS
ncbi:MAG: hypothetical protein ACOY0S_03405 [Patescibacteria group bacterium]